ncbi:MAG: hypothetical protein F4X02_12660 [Chloroflexi bacterium]|nr:hypothetical protein [Chloroflexota bacterium]
MTRYDWVKVLMVFTVGALLLAAAKAHDTDYDHFHDEADDGQNEYYAIQATGQFCAESAAWNHFERVFLSGETQTDEKKWALIPEICRMLVTVTAASRPDSFSHDYWWQAPIVFKTVEHCHHALQVFSQSYWEGEPYYPLCGVLAHRAERLLNDRLNFDRVMKLNSDLQIANYKLKRENEALKAKLEEAGIALD